MPNPSRCHTNSDRRWPLPASALASVENPSGLTPEPQTLLARSSSRAKNFASCAQAIKDICWWGAERKPAIV